MERSSIIHNFKLLSSRPVEELQAVLHQMEHQTSGARLVWLERPEENKTFGIAFQTQPWDDTGVFHILEHSVLCGSDHYPVKEPFVELLKSSMNTFLNALTFRDKTFYPVSSRNRQDFYNLMRVYMDAVLHPLIHQKPEIFGQEGWHYELDQEGLASYKGVVFNEMKGSFSSPDTLRFNEIFRRLFPDTCYRFVSGGDPAHIPELTGQQFREAHTRLYHPSNSYIFLDGDLDIEAVLGILDQEYLASFAQVPTPGPIPFQQPVDGGVSEITYELSGQEELAGRARLVEGFVACTFQDRPTLMALHALADVLCGDNQAPLKRRLLEEGLARDLQMTVCDGILQPWVSLEAKDLDEEKFDQTAAALRQELERLAQEGLDHKRLLATLDNLEFQERERDFDGTPQGIVFGMQVLETWLYGGDPAANLTVGDLFNQLRAQCSAGYFEELIRRVFLDNPHKCRVLMRPSHTLGQERQAQERERLLAAQAQWTQEDTARLRSEQAAIEAWQAAPDSPEALASIPMLKLEEVDPEPKPLPLSVEKIAGRPLLRHELPAGGITYVNLYFDLGDLNGEQLSQASFLARLLGSLETDSHDLEALQREMRSRFGQVSFSVEAYGSADGSGQCRTFLCASCSALDSKLEQALPLLAELLTETHWNDSKRVYEFLCQRRAALSERLVSSGHVTALDRTAACTSVEGVVREQAGGVEFLRWMKALEAGFEEKFPALAQTLAALAGSLFTRARLTASLTGSNPAAAGLLGSLLAGRLPAGSFVGPAVPAVQPWGQRREGILIPSGVSYAALGGSFPTAGQGQTKVMGRTVSLAYLWNAVRVQGGAYGVGMVVRDSGFGGFYSYRDPSPGRTLECYAGSAEFLKTAKDMDLTGMILGAVAEADPLLTPRMKGKASDSRYWRGVSQEDLRRARREMLEAKPAGFLALAGQVEAFAASSSICVMGPKKALEDCGGKLDTVAAL